MERKESIDMTWTDSQYREFLGKFETKIASVYENKIINGEKCFIRPEGDCFCYAILHPVNDEIFIVIDRAIDENEMIHYHSDDCETYCISDYSSVDEMEALMLEEIQLKGIIEVG